MEPKPPLQSTTSSRLSWTRLRSGWRAFVVASGVCIATVICLFSLKVRSLREQRSCYLNDVIPYAYPLARPPLPTTPPLRPDWVRRPNRPFIRGISLGMYFKNQMYDYDQFLHDIKALGATSVGFVISWYQKNVRATEIKRHHEKTVSDARLITTIHQARARGLRVFLLPIVRLQERGNDDWRGVIKPTDLEAWWRSYRDYILHYADLSRQHGVELFSVGSELVSMETHRDRWVRLIRNIRRLFPGPLVYSANWDHYEPVTFWESLDYIGISNYYELSKKEMPSTETLRKAWTRIRTQIERWKQNYPRQKLIFTEVGYYSQIGTNIYPWDYTRDKERSLEEQRRCYKAFIQTWSQSQELRGTFFWNWFSPGGPQDKGYSPRGKPAECELRAWYKSIRNFEEDHPQPRWLRPQLAKGWKSAPSAQPSWFVPPSASRPPPPRRSSPNPSPVRATPQQAKRPLPITDRRSPL